MATREIRPKGAVRVLHVIVHLSPGGAELMLKRLLDAVRSQPEYEHSVISLRGLGTVGPMLLAAGTHVTALGFDRPWHLPRTLLRLRAAIKRSQADIVQTWMYHADLLGGLAAKTLGLPVIWGVRVADIGPRVGVSPITSVIRRICALLSKRIPAKIVYVAQSARLSHEAVGYDPEKSVVIRNGYLMPRVVARSAIPDMRRRLGLPEAGPLIVSAGRFNAQKNHRGFIEAFSLIAADHPDVHTVMCGSGVEPGNAELAGTIERLGLEGRVLLLGERRDLNDILSSADTLCLHSLTEGFPNVVAEAMAAGIPCVVTDVGDAAFLVADTGLVVPPNDSGELAAGLARLLAMPAAQRLALGRRARARIEKNFSIAAIAREYENLYSEIRFGQAGSQAPAPDRNKSDLEPGMSR